MMIVIRFLIFSLFSFSLAKAESLTPCFTPGQNCTHAIVKKILDAKYEILVRAYSFTSQDIADALIKAHHKGVRVFVLYDKSQDKDSHSLIRLLKNAGISTRIDIVSGIAHNKVIIVDKKIVITGSFNFTKAAQKRNAENVLFVESDDVAYAYREDWIKHFEKSKK